MTPKERQKLLRKLKHGPKMTRKELAKWMIKQEKKIREEGR